jgi:penicillin amidase
MTNPISLLQGANVICAPLTKLRAIMQRLPWTYAGLAALCLGAWIFFGNYAGPAGLPVPALGPFFHPPQGFWTNTLPETTDRSGERSITIDHPQAKGEIFFDERSVPHIFADDLESACFLQGYVMAADRLWQMDISTRSTEGRLSEVLGSRTLSRDIDQIRRGYRVAAQRTVDTMMVHFPDDYRAAVAYSDGVNAFIDQLSPEQYPFEYKFFDHAPLRWSPYRSALLLKGMAQGLSARYEDVAAEKTLAYLGEEAYRELFPDRFPDASPIVPDEAYANRRNPKTSAAQSASISMAPARRGNSPEWVSSATSDSRERDLNSVAQAHPTQPNRPVFATTEEFEEEKLPFTSFPRDPDNGSNNWAVSGKKSNTGSPLMANDPHLGLSLPSVWYEAQIKYGDVNARGVGLPGAAGLAMGYNDHIAWGETNVGHDVTDWYRITWTDSSRTHYLLDGETVAATIVRDTIIIKGEEDLVIETPWTIFGPVPLTEGPYADMAMRWMAHDAPGQGRPHSTGGTFLRLQSATSYDDYVDALRGYVNPAQNFLMASRQGDVAMRPNGYFPLRPEGNGRFPYAGDTRASSWRGYIPFEERPVHKNPARGFVSSANQVTTGPKYPYPYQGRFGEYRGRIINRKLSRETTMNQRKMKELQLSSYSLLAEELVPWLIARVDRGSLDDNGRQLLRVLSEWDYYFTAESRGATLFEQWRQKVYDLTFDELPRDSGYLRPEIWLWNDLLSEQPDHVIFDIDSTENFRETAATLTQRAFDELLEELDGQLPEPWYIARDARIQHLGRIPGFGTNRIKAPGARMVPRVFDDGFGASWRMVVELGENPRAWGALPGGPSGQPASQHYTTGLDDWINGRYHELTRWRSTEEAKSAAVGHWRFN